MVLCTEISLIHYITNQRPKLQNKLAQVTINMFSNKTNISHSKQTFEKCDFNIHSAKDIFFIWQIWGSISHIRLTNKEKGVIVYFSTL